MMLRYIILYYMFKLAEAGRGSALLVLAGA